MVSQEIEEKESESSFPSCCELWLWFSVDDDISESLLSPD